MATSQKFTLVGAGGGTLQTSVSGSNVNVSILSDKC